MNMEQTNMGAVTEAHKAFLLKCPLTNTKQNKLQQSIKN